MPAYRLLIVVCLGINDNFGNKSIAIAANRGNRDAGFSPGRTLYDFSNGAGVVAIRPRGFYPCFLTDTVLDLDNIGSVAGVINGSENAVAHNQITLDGTAERLEKEAVAALYEAQPSLKLFCGWAGVVTAAPLGAGETRLGAEAGRSRLLAWNDENRLSEEAGETRLEAEVSETSLLAKADETRLEAEAGEIMLLAEAGETTLGAEAGRSRLLAEASETKLWTKAGRSKLLANTGGSRLLAEASETRLLA
ncbi:Arginine-glutamic acid dipeptide repeats protein-like [Plakobranchus ocellatus]|uniref:Arginine-glutamic acid dipeptide repeats protein-like n=1 Tax=Plakobranchus ocellatus TaxID=259542 RepID=A0AAV3ZC85_9GAST|nr:Arginine-glutamic acid dipeptide repeats protein-like [Plakobranchus ocellatus]